MAMGVVGMLPVVATSRIKDYSGPDQQAGGYAGTYDGGYAGGFGGGYGAAGYESEPSQQIIVRNVSQISVLPLDWQSS